MSTNWTLPKHFHPKMASRLTTTEGDGAGSSLPDGLAPHRDGTRPGKRRDDLDCGARRRSPDPPAYFPCFTFSGTSTYLSALQVQAQSSRKMSLPLTVKEWVFLVFNTKISLQYPASGLRSSIRCDIRRNCESCVVEALDASSELNPTMTSGVFLSWRRKAL